ncbi:MAG TPA: DMT family transporter [Anaerolineales bacterium]
MTRKNPHLAGIQAALTSALFLGLAPVFGKQAILAGLSPLVVVSLRTGLAVVLLAAGMFAFRRRYFYIYPAGLLGCCLAGGINGIGSLLYYSALGRLNAGLGQLLYGLYPLFVAVFMGLDRQPPSRLTAFRLALVLPALYLLVADGLQPVDWVGAGLMLAAALLYALHLPINQRVLYDMPAPTVTLYTLLAMGAVVGLAYLLSGSPLTQPAPTISPQAWQAVLALTLVTFLSRLTLFVGVKNLGGLQTAMLGLSEMLVTVLVSHLWLGERFSPQQWLGAALLVAGLGLVGLEKAPLKKQAAGGWLSWLRPPGIPANLRERRGAG